MKWKEERKKEKKNEKKKKKKKKKKKTAANIIGRLNRRSFARLLLEK